MSFLLRRKVAALAVAGTGLAVVLSGAFAPAATAAPVLARAASPAAAEAPWFVDPRTPAERRAEVAVPKKPKKYAGKVRETRAVYRTKAGRLAVPMRAAFGQRVVEGLAVTLDGNGLFVINTTKPTAAARTQVTRLAAALVEAASVRCEGYADYAGTARWNRVLAAGRATAICDLLVERLPGLSVTTASYGPSWPAVLGGTSEDRRLNRRVVVEMTGTRVPAPPAPTVPTVPTPPVGPTLTVPGPPVLTRVTSSVGRIDYRFTAPTDDGGSPVTGYEVSTADGWEPVLQALTRSGKAPSACRVDCYTGLSGILVDQPVGVVRDLRVRAINKIGAGGPSNTLSASAYGYPSAPTALTLVGGNAQLTATFGAPEHDGGSEILGYEISYDGGLSYEEVDGGSVTKAGLVNGTVYDVVVRAVNGWGSGERATASVRVATVPDAPWLESQVDLSGTSATLTFTTPQLDGGTDGGAAISGYEITRDGGTTWAAFGYTPDTEPGVFRFTLEDLTLGSEYAVAVRAVNERGPGASSKTRTFVPLTVPGPPVLDRVVGSIGLIHYEFTAPTEDGGSPITGYEVSVGDGWEPVVSYLSRKSSRACRAGCYSGLYGILADQPAGVVRDLRVRAINKVGAGGPSNTLSASAYDYPSAPTGLTLVGGDRRLTATFGAPEHDGGSEILGYEISYDGGLSYEEVDGGSVTKAGLTNGVVYDVRVRAHNRWGHGTSAAGTVLVTWAPDAPAIRYVAFNGHYDRWVVGYTPGADNGSVVTGFEVSVDDGVWIGSTAAADGEAVFPCTYLQCGWTSTSTVRLRAVTMDAASPPSAPYLPSFE